MKLLLGVALFFPVIGVARAFAQQSQNDDGHHGNDRPVYQRHAFDGMRRDDGRDRRDFRRGFSMMSPQISAGWFQRPYPYHLDYYRMRYNGSYAPYFGNLYGTPQVVNYPPYYGPYYGGGGYGAGFGGGFANGSEQPGYSGIPMEYPAAPGAIIPRATIEESQNAKPQAEKAGSEALPAP